MSQQYILNNDMGTEALRLRPYHPLWYVMLCYDL